MGFTPERLGRSTTVAFSFSISEPAPLRSVVLSLPPGIGFARTSLGLEPCQQATLVDLGPEGCPADSLIGQGTAFAEVLAESEVEETASVFVLIGPEDGEAMNVLFFVDGKSPVNREVILSGALLFARSESSSATLSIKAPLLRAWPGGPEIGVVRFRSTIGPAGLTYYRRIDGKTVAFKPRGLTLPRRCPRGGFPVSAKFAWWGLAETASVTTHVRCPAKSRT